MKEVKGLIGFIFGVLSLLTGGNFLCAVFAFIFSSIGLVNNYDEKDYKFAIAGLVVGLVVILLTALILVTQLSALSVILGSIK